MPYVIIAVVAATIVCLLLNAMRYGSDAARGTSAHVNLYLWRTSLAKLQIEDICAAGIAESPLPLRLSREKLEELARVWCQRSGSQLSLPDLDDPWGCPVLIELVSQRPKPRWRVRSRIGRSFFGFWWDKTEDIEAWA
jgi:hypothetical protein